jgi:nucleotide-binding universal stress UspA family protein
MASTIRRETKEWCGFQSVLCPIDFSEQSRRALQYAKAVVRRGHSRLSVLYVNDPLLVAAAAAALHDTNVAKRSSRELTAFVNSAIGGRSRSTRRVDTVVAMGNPVDEILRAAARRRVDLIVAGTHGLTGVERLAIGSTALGLLQRAAVPILAVPFLEASPAADIATDWPGGRILAAIDLDEESPKEVHAAARVARWFGSSLLLAHVVRSVAAPAWLAKDLSANDRIAIGRAETQLETLAASGRRLIPTDARVVCGRPADEIAALVASERISLVMTALRDRRGWFGTRRGSVSYHVLSHAVAPVLAYPPRWRPR